MKYCLEHWNLMGLQNPGSRILSLGTSWRTLQALGCCWPEVSAAVGGQLSQPGLACWMKACVRKLTSIWAMEKRERLKHCMPVHRSWNAGFSDNIFLFCFEICRCLKKHRYFCYLFAVGMDGLSCLFLPVLQSFPLLVPFSFTFGYFDGAYVTLIPVVTADAVGTPLLSSALGVVYFLHAIPYLVSPPVAGQFCQMTSL